MAARGLVPVLIALLAILALAASPASAGEFFADHNGSLMRAFSQPPYLRIVYDRPRPGLWPYGVAPGTLLFEGAWQGGVLVGTAFVFSACGPVPYQVSGGAGSDGLLVLQGPAPLVFGCAVFGFGLTPNSYLQFIPLRRD